MDPRYLLIASLGMPDQAHLNSYQFVALTDM